MFLNYLDKEIKIIFLELAFCIANIDNDFADEEKTIIANFRMEMGLTEDNYQIQNIPPEKLLLELEKCEPYIKRVILFEIVAVALADNVIVEAEKELLKLMMASFNFDNNLLNKFIDVVQHLKTVYIEINDLINPKEN